MLAHRYQIWPKQHWGAPLDGSAAIEKRLVAVTTIAKRDPECHFQVFNELVAMRLGQILGLPVASGIVIERNSEVYFASCHLLAAGGDLPKADFERFAKDKPHEACGVTIFDAWIANDDRHDENLWYDYYDDKYFLIDHGASLLGGAGDVRLSSEQNRIALRTDQYSLTIHIRSFNDFHWWYQKLNDIPNYTIHATCRMAAECGVDPLLAQECANWIIERRKNLPKLFADNREIFTKLQTTMLDPFGGYDDLYPEYCI